jgi:hypothetical protein
MGSSRKLALTLVALLVIWGVGVAPAQASDDTWITTKIRIALMTTDGAGRNAVKVDTEHGKPLPMLPGPTSTACRRCFQERVRHAACSLEGRQERHT